MARTKSLEDFDRQWERLKNNYRLNSERNRRVNEVMARYTRNIMSTKRFNDDDRNQIKAFREGGQRAYQAAKKTLRNRQYSRRTYMGLNGG